MQSARFAEPVKELRGARYGAAAFISVTLESLARFRSKPPGRSRTCKPRRLNALKPLRKQYAV
eukprot:CAMPEP_0202047810 /NCGR_PEP_ID=MMETSP0963-20130614/2231_1 /ASSEMBLY_ACC=CAM_ASM_000494 /TAXON_ID=4773 /ORGANISM="Schizochytrium aggregatum, Strain ATCC28209" /LENGTH=62 /DNA_ID=CAMNT_0048612609 /DNA_START=237 /DNA_END=425 /DNA_ORIENTATION=+